MQPTTYPIASAQVVMQTLGEFGYDTLDFEVDEAGPEVSIAFGPCEGVVAVRRRSSGQQRVYVCQAGPAWQAEVAADVRSGRFGAPN